MFIQISKNPGCSPSPPPNPPERFNHGGSETREVFGDAVIGGAGFRPPSHPPPRSLWRGRHQAQARQAHYGTRSKACSLKRFSIVKKSDIVSSSSREMVGRPKCVIESM